MEMFSRFSKMGGERGFTEEVLWKESMTRIYNVPVYKGQKTVGKIWYILNFNTLKLIFFLNIVVYISSIRLKVGHYEK